MPDLFELLQQIFSCGNILWQLDSEFLDNINGPPNNVFRKKVQQLKYVSMGSTHTPGTLRAIPSVFLNRLAKLASRNTSLHSEGVEKIYPDHANARREAGLAPPIFPTME